MGQWGWGRWIETRVRGGRGFWDGSFGESLTESGKQPGDLEVNMRSEAEIRKMAGPSSSQGWITNVNF